jgi:hypothetical protein
MARSDIVSVRFSAVERQRLQSVADELGCTISDFIRRLVLNEVLPIRSATAIPSSTPSTTLSAPATVTWKDAA